MTQRREGRGRTFSGVILIAVGILVLMGNFGVFPIRQGLSFWWPAILILLGVKHLLECRGMAAWGGGLFWIGTGALFLARNMGYVRMEFSSAIWPLMLIWFGVLLAFGSGNRCSETIEDGRES